MRQNYKSLANILNIFVCSLIMFFSFGSTSSSINTPLELNEGLKNAGIEFVSVTSKTSKIEKEEEVDKKVINNLKTLPLLFNNVTFIIVVGAIIIVLHHKFKPLKKVRLYLYSFWANAPPVFSFN